MKTEDEMRELLYQEYRKHGVQRMPESIKTLHVIDCLRKKRRVSAAMARALGYRMEGKAKGVRTYHELTTK